MNTFFAMIDNATGNTIELFDTEAEALAVRRSMKYKNTSVKSVRVPSAYHYESN
jgi:hypothetical protein